MEALLRELIAINREMLAEMRLIRQSLGAERPQAVHVQEQSQVAELAAGLDLNMQDIPRAAPRYTPEDLEDIRGSLLSGIKQRNKEKSNAYSEFEKLHRGR